MGVFRAYTDVALREAIKTGIVLGPRMLIPGAYLTVSGAGGEVSGLVHRFYTQSLSRLWKASAPFAVAWTVPDPTAAQEAFVG
jgi:hypothetical protein